MQKIILLLVLSLLSVFFLQQTVAVDVRECLPTTGATAVDVFPQDAATTVGNLGDLSDIAVNQNGTYIWVIANLAVDRYTLENGFITGSAVRIGKTNCTTPVDRRSICNPFALLIDNNDNLFVVDNAFRRILVFSNASTPDYTGLINRPTKVIGANSFTSYNSANDVNNFNLSGPISVAYYAAGDALYVLDGNNGGNGSGVATATRILRYDGFSTQKNFLYVADTVFGQKNTSLLTTQSTSLSSFVAAYITVDQSTGNLFVADANNSRVLVFKAAQSLSNDASASDYIGQSSSSAHVSGTSNNRLTDPTGLYFDHTGNQLFIADYENNRVVVVHGTNSPSNDPTFTTVIGQTSFTTKNATESLSSLNMPISVQYNNATGYIFVADSGNGRVLTFGPCATAVSTPSHSVTKNSAAASASLAASVPSTSASPVTQSPSASTASFSNGASHFSKSGAGSVSAAASAPTTSPVASLSPVQLTTTGSSSSSTGTTGTTGARRLRRRL